MGAWNRRTDLRGEGGRVTGRDEPKNFYADNSVVKAWGRSSVEEGKRGRGGTTCNSVNK